MDLILLLMARSDLMSVDGGGLPMTPLCEVLSPGVVTGGSIVFMVDLGNRLDLLESINLVDICDLGKARPF